MKKYSIFGIESQGDGTVREVCQVDSNAEKLVADMKDMTTEEGDQKYSDVWVICWRLSHDN
jgi:hypothetical protein